jgi:hypothetical protein
MYFIYQGEDILSLLYQPCNLGSGFTSGGCFAQHSLVYVRTFTAYALCQGFLFSSLGLHVLAILHPIFLFMSGFLSCVELSCVCQGFLNSLYQDFLSEVPNHSRCLR